MTEEYETLTQEELEALQSTRNDEHLTKLANGESAEVVKHDLASQHNNARVDNNVFEAICATVSGRLEQSVSSVLNIPMSIGYAATEVASFETVTEKLDTPIASTSLRLDPMEGEALVLIDSRIIFDSLDRFFGGAGVSTIGFSPDRAFAGSEEAIVDIVITLVSSALKEGWAPITAASFEKSRSADSPGKLKCFREDELVVISRFRATIGEESGEIAVLYPLASVRTVTQSHAKKSGKQERASDSSEWSRDLQQACLELEVEISAQLGKFTTTLGALSALKVGDEFKLSRNESLEIRVGDVPLFTATSGRIGDLVAVRIDSVNKS